MTQKEERKEKLPTQPESGVTSGADLGEWKSIGALSTIILESARRAKNS